MNLKISLFAALLIVSSLSCGPDQPADSSSDAVLSAPAAAPSAPTAASAAAVPPAPAINAPPRDARYTIYCLAVTGPDHIARANQVKLLWQQATGRKDWYVIHQDDQSLVYFGYYRSISDTKDRDTARAIADRKMLQNLKDTVGDQPFEQAMLLPLDAPDPTAPPQYNLLNAKGDWTLEIAVYHGAGRKEAAVESVKKARDMGIEAYYYHGPSASSVCIGAWPAEAVTQNLDAQIKNTDPNQPIMAVPDPIAAQMPNEFTDPEGNKTKVVHNDAQINDPTLAAMMQKFPVHSINGEEDTIMVGGKAVPRASAVVAIPHSNDSAGPTLPNQPPPVNLLGGDGSDSTGGDNTAGRLRSMGQ